MPRSLEYRLQPDDQLCFVRIPKTGSTTLISILDAQFALSEICPYLVAELPHADPAELDRYRLFRDHFDYDIKNYLSRSPVYLTMLRHPIDRAISYYEFCKRGTNPGPFDQYLKQAANQGLKAFVCHPDPTIRIRTANLQIRQIAAGLGNRHANPFEASPLESQYSDDDLLALAKAHLQEFAFVGVTERFNDAVLLLAYIFGWYPVKDYQSLRVANKKAKRDELDQDTLNAIAEANQQDLELYEYAQHLFAEQYQQMQMELQQKYGEFNLDQTHRVLEKHYEARYTERSPDRLTTLDFNFLQAMSGSGWHRRNGAYSGLRVKGIPFRWTGPGTESTLDFPLAIETDLTIRIRVTNAVTADVLESLQLKVNGQIIPLTLSLRRGNTAVFEGILPQSILATSSRLTRLTFCVNRTVSLQAINPSGSDQRIVGLAIQGLQIFPPTTFPEQAGFGQFLFPQFDPPWDETVAFIQQWLQPDDAIAAPIEFSEKFPQQFCSYRQSFTQQPGLTWVVIHKGFMTEIDFASLQWTIQHLKPVLANAVFVVFSNHSTCPSLQSDRPAHLQAFWQDCQQFCLKRWGIENQWVNRFLGWLNR
jgi:hypothetical protein